jgi:hypothetical protein
MAATGVSHVTLCHVTDARRRQESDTYTVASSLTPLSHGIVIRARELPSVSLWSASRLGIGASIHEPGSRGPW